MDAKEYLSQAYRIDQRINSKLEQVMSLRALLGKATGTLSGAPKAATPNLHSMEDTICKMVDMENEINNDIDTLVDLKAEIMACIKRVENTEYQTLLELRYLCFKRWEDVAAELGYDLRYVYKLHDQALESCTFENGQEKTLKDTLLSVRYDAISPTDKFLDFNHIGIRFCGAMFRFDSASDHVDGSNKHKSECNDP